VAGAGALALAAVLSLAGPLPAAGAGRTAVLAAMVLAAASRHGSGLAGSRPAVAPAVLLFAASRRGNAIRAERERLAAAPRGNARASPAGRGVLAAIVYPALVHDHHHSLRMQVEENYAPLVLRQPEWRQFVLQAPSGIDAMNVLEEGRRHLRPGAEELAFAVWSATDLAPTGFSSAIEIQDTRGRRDQPLRAQPAVPSSASAAARSSEWNGPREPVTWPAQETMVLHAQRLLTNQASPRPSTSTWARLLEPPLRAGADPYCRAQPPRHTPAASAGHRPSRHASSVARHRPAVATTAFQVTPDGLDGPAHTRGGPYRR